MRIQDKVAIVTGGGSGIGHGTGIRLAEEGAAVAIFDIDLEGAENTAREIRKAGGQALALRVDVSQAEDVESAVQEVISTLRKVDILVNNAGLSTMTSIAKMSEDAWDSTLDVNLKGVFLCCRAVIPRMKERRYGKIVNISSILGLTGSPARVHYSAAKTGVIGFTRGLAAELGPFNINVNAVGPGIIDTPMLERDVGTELRQRLPERVPLRRLGAPRDIANAVLFLVSDESSYISGQCLFVCGGISSSAGLA
ncbi:MAG: SDR family oxidoreductase [Dehalococcoidia bacterium]|nr:MAG: SDR family oxidoreductase [Dehalococcoidia bacterium]